MTTSERLAVSIKLGPRSGVNAMSVQADLPWLHPGCSPKRLPYLEMLAEKFQPQVSGPQTRTDRTNLSDAILAASDATPGSVPGRCGQRRLAGMI